MMLPQSKKSRSVMRSRKRGGIVQRIILKRLVAVAAMVVMVLAIAVPTFAQILPQGEPGVTDPVGDGGSVPEDVTSTLPSSTEDVDLPTTDATNDPTAPVVGGAADMIPIKLSNELCADLTNPLVTGTFSLVVPDLVTGCLNRASEPTDPADTAPVQRVSDTSLTPSVNQAPVEEPGSVEPASGHLAELTDKTAPADTAAPADTTTVPSV
jgi:hypothetical protein